MQFACKQISSLSFVNAPCATVHCKSCCLFKAKHGSQCHHTGITSDKLPQPGVLSLGQRFARATRNFAKLKRMFPLFRPIIAWLSWLIMRWIRMLSCTSMFPHNLSLCAWYIFFLFIQYLYNIKYIYIPNVYVYMLKYIYIYISYCAGFMIDHVFLAPAQDYKILQVMCLLSTRIHVRPKSPAWAHDVTHTHTPHMLVDTQATGMKWLCRRMLAHLMDPTYTRPMYIYAASVEQIYPCSDSPTSL